MKPLDFYTPRGFDIEGFGQGSVIVDVGCGTGRHLRPVAAKGVKVIGVDISEEKIRALQAMGYDARAGQAERLPVQNEECVGVMCSVVLAYTDERKTVAEWARVLKPGGEVRATYSGMGYAMRMIAIGPSLRERLYGFKGILNSWHYSLVGRNLPGRLGGFIVQSRRRLRRYYREFGFELLEEHVGASFAGGVVTFGHRLVKHSRH